MCRLALLSLLPFLLAAQQVITLSADPAQGKTAARQHPTDPNNPPAQPQATDPAGLCTLEGQVVDTLTGAPIRKASLILTRTEGGPSNLPPPSYSTSSDAGGHFAMKDIEPGQYRLMATRNGYVTMNYGARGPARAGTVLSLARQQHLTELTMKLTPHGVIAGRVVDEDGDPVANARVTLQSLRYAQGRRQLMNAGGGASTNDLGEYRIFGVAPGKYYVSVLPAGGPQSNAWDHSAAAAPEEDYVATYYPAAIDPASAVQVEVGAGAQLRGIDVRLLKVRTVHVRGHVSDSVGGRRNIQVVLVSRNSGGMMAPSRSTPRVDAAGNFDIRGVSPGAYYAVALVYAGNANYQAKAPVDVGASNVQGIELAVGPGVTMRGRIRAEEGAAPAPDLTGVMVSLEPREAGAVFFGGEPGQPKEDGTFEIANVQPDAYRWNFNGLPKGAYVKAIRTPQADLLAGVDLTSGAPPGAIEVTISARAAAVTGTVQNPKTGNPASGATVVLVPQDPERREQTSYFKTITTDQNGSFSLEGVAPGEYEAYAWEDVEAGAYLDPDFLKPLEQQGEPVSLEEGDRKSLTLKLIPADR